MDTFERTVKQTLQALNDGPFHYVSRDELDEGLEIYKNRAQNNYTWSKSDYTPIQDFRRRTVRKYLKGRPSWPMNTY